MAFRQAIYLHSIHIPHEFYVGSPNPITGFSQGELCARTLPRVMPSLRPALVAGYQRPVQLGGGGEGGKSVANGGQIWGFMGRIFLFSRISLEHV